MGSTSLWEEYKAKATPVQFWREQNMAVLSLLKPLVDEGLVREVNFVTNATNTNRPAGSRELAQVSWAQGERVYEWTCPASAYLEEGFIRDKLVPAIRAHAEKATHAHVNPSP